MDKVERLGARQEIRNLLNSYCHGIDRRDWDLVRSCFGEDHEHSHQSFQGNLDEFVSFAKSFQTEVATSHHSITNAKIQISEDGKSAHCDSNFIAFHMIEAGKFPKRSLPSNGQGTHWTLAGRYIDDLKYRNGAWVIVKREAYNQWSRQEPV